MTAQTGTARAEFACGLIALAGGVMVGLVGCTTNPFAEAPGDKDIVASEDRLRRIGTLRLDRLDIDAAGTPEEQIEQARNRYAGRDKVEVTIDEIRMEAFEHNLGLRSTLVDPVIAAERVSQEEGAFDTLFTLDATWFNGDDATASALDNGQSESQSLTPGVTVPLRTGGEISLSTPLTRFETDNSFSTLNPAYTADLELSLSHNLLRGAGRKAATHGIRLAEYDRQISEAQAKLEVIRTLADVDRAYWRLFASIRALEVEEQQYKVAVEQLERAQRRERAGSGAEIDVVRAQSGVADRVEQIIRAQNDVTLLERELKLLVNAPGLEVGSETGLVPASDPEPVLYRFDAERLVEAAVENRMDLLEVELRLARDAAQIAFDRNQTLPLLALQYTYRVNGLDDSIGDAAQVTAQGRFEDWSVGVQAQLPLSNRAREATLAQSILARLQRLATRDAREEQIEKEVRDAVDQLSSTWQRIMASRQAVVLNARALDAERRQFDVGRSTSTDVLDADTNLADARLAEIRAVVEYQIAQIDLAVATGTLMGQAGVDWAPRDPRGGTSREEQEPRRYDPLSGAFGRD
ncbi:MAG: TolC family protein [Planctomycetota bacterium]